jgi:ferredoxin-NADP reductase
MWRTVAVAAVRPETAHARTLTLDAADWPGHRPGQHVDLRLTADDGYQAVRSYSIASAPESSAVDVTVELVDDGEVSPYLVEEARVGDEFEIRGPLGGYFVWTVDDGGPLLLIGGGSGLVPLMSMLRHRRARHAAVPVRALVSARAADDVLYADELTGIDRDDGAAVHITLTRDAPPGWTGFTRRVDREMLTEVSFTAAEQPSVFVCGPTGFVETAASLLVELGHDPKQIRTERFGPTGG